MTAFLAALAALLPTLLPLIAGFVAAKLHTKLAAASPNMIAAVNDGTAVAKALVDALENSVPAPK